MVVISMDKYKKKKRLEQIRKKLEGQTFNEDKKEALIDFKRFKKILDSSIKDYQSDQQKSEKD